MPKAMWRGTILAESEETVIIDGKHYFPRACVNMNLLVESETRSVCPWKGTAVYFHLRVDGDIVSDAAWSYPAPTTASEEVRNHVAFWKGVEIQE